MNPSGSAVELKRFLGTMSYYRRFILNFSKIASYLYRLSESESKFKLDHQANEIFEKLKDSLVKAPVLINPDFSKPFVLETDASDFALGSVNKPIAFASRHLTKTERNYSTSEKELLAIVWAMRHFNSYIYNRDVIVLTDHKPLADLKKLKEPNGRLGRLNVTKL